MSAAAKRPAYDAGIEAPIETATPITDAAAGTRAGTAVPEAAADDDTGKKAESLAVSRTSGALPLPLIMKEIQARYGKSFNQILGEIVKLSFGPGKISVEEYLELGLFDDEALAGTDKRNYVGYTVTQKIWKQANFRRDWTGFFDDKLAATTLLGAYGFPIIPTLAVFSKSRNYPALRTLGDDDDLRAFLIDRANYPLFGKPLAGIQSLGAASFDSFCTESGNLITVDGANLPIDEFIADLMKHYGAGYIFQRRVVPHSRIREICGDRLATVRVMTILTHKGPEVLRAMWKIPAGANAADNFWRKGNLLAQLDVSDGRIMRVVSGTGLDAVSHETHPDTGIQLVGTRVPNWETVIETALDAARTLKELPLIGWDIAPLDTGALIVEPNQSPDLHLPQIADKRGIMDERFRTFLAECDDTHAKRKKAAKAEVLAHYRDTRKRMLKSATTR